MRQPDILILEGLNVLQITTESREFVSDYFDYSIYIDALESDIERWYIERFLKLRETVFMDPRSYFRHYADAHRGRGDRDRPHDLAGDQRQEPGREHRADAGSGVAHHAQGGRPHRHRGPAPQDLRPRRQGAGAMMGRCPAGRPPPRSSSPWRSRAAPAGRRAGAPRWPDRPRRPRPSAAIATTAATTPATASTTTATTAPTTTAVTSTTAATTTGHAASGPPPGRTCPPPRRPSPRRTALPAGDGLPDGTYYAVVDGARGRCLTAPAGHHLRAADRPGRHRGRGGRRRRAGRRPLRAGAAGGDARDRAHARDGAVRGPP